MKILYAGSPDISVIPLRHLVEENNHQLVGVLTNPPSSQGRSKTPIATPVAQYAQEIGIPVLEPEKLTAEVREAVAQLQPDILVCFAYGKIFGPKFIALFPQGGINIHPSLLPKYRGCAPVPAAILNQESETGVSIQRIAQEMDTGNILCQKVISLNGTENSQTLLEKASFLGAEMVAEVLENISCGKVTEIEQDNSQATYSSLLEKKDGLIDWSKSAAAIDAKIRAFFPWPGAFTQVNNLQLRIHAARVFDTIEDENLYKDEPCGKVLYYSKQQGFIVKCGQGFLALQELQLQAKKAMDYKAFYNGNQNFVGSCLL